MPEFIHLHNHSHFSLLDGAATIDGLIGAAREHRMDALALTDHGVMFGAVEFHKAANKAGIKPILGCEVYIVTQGSRFDREVNAKSMAKGQGRGIYQHLVLLAKNQTGYRNLIKLCSLGHTEGFYYKPRIDMELLREYSAGLICLSACPSGVISVHLINEDFAQARATAATFKEIFGDDFYLEIQDHGLEKEKPILAGMPRLAKDLSIKLVATNDVHYIRQDHAVAHNVLLLIPDSSASSASDYRQLRYQTDQIYFKSPEEMCSLFRHVPEAIKSTLEISEKIESYPIGPKTPHMPDFPIPSEVSVETLDDYLDLLAHEGLKSRYPTVTPEIHDRATHELSVIKKMGYSGYFLITQDFINAARSLDVSVGPGRGSAAGSIVSYALGITDVDPLKYDLLFERFLNPDRVTMPDIDIDFSDKGRDRVIEYVKKKYGDESVSQIITFGTLSSRAVIKDVARVLGVQLSVAESITKHIPSIQGKVTPLSEALETLPDLQWVKESSDDKIKELIRISLVLEGMNRNSSTHAAGVVIAPGPITDYVPIHKTPQTEAMTQYNMTDLEAAGLLKMDFLGLRTLTIIEHTLKLIQARHSVSVDLSSIPENDPKTFELFARGHTVGIFQFESTGMSDWLRKLKPTSISDLVAMNALYRPGPMEMIGDFISRKQGGKIQYLHPKLEPILKETYGIIVYQEQVMRIASEVAGFSLAKADMMRRAMGKKDQDLMSRQRNEFVEGAVQQGFSHKIAGDIFDMIQKFASYGFNKSHSVAYSIVAYRTAYLKAQYPEEYLASCLSAEIGDTTYVVQLIDECRKLHIEVLPPDVNESHVEFVVVPRGIRFGMSAIKNVGVNAVEQIIRARDSGGKFKNIFDFCARVDLRIVNKKTIEGLVQAGAFDSIDANRARLFEVIERAIQFGQGVQGMKAAGQSTLFELTSSAGAQSHPALPEVLPWAESDKLIREKQVLGFYVSGHPLLKFEREMRAFSTARLSDPAAIKSGSIVRVSGIVSDVRRKVDRNGNMMAFFTLQDFSSKGECIIFAEPFKRFQQMIADDAMVLVSGKGETNGDSLKILVNDVCPLDRVTERFTKSVMLSLKLDEMTDETIKRLKEIAQRYKGKCSCFVKVITDTQGLQSATYSTQMNVQPSTEFVRDVENILGPQAIKFLS